jgi:alpha,alpha-trehalase
VDHGEQAAALLKHGADIVVNDLAELDCGEDEPATPSALQHLEEITPPQGKRLAIFLDYDGTLTPIVSRPDMAILSASMRATLEHLSRRCTLAVISGRDLRDVRSRVDIDHIFYAGSHGFDIAGPGKEQVQYEQGTEYLSLLDQAEQELREKLAHIEGCLIERKRFSIAVHYRQVEAPAVQQLKETVAEVLHLHTQLRLSKGKKVYELQPNIDWHKGKALRWLLQALELKRDDVIPLYIGDDVTDEDAFAAIRDDGIGILVAEKARQTQAHYLLKDPQEVQRFLAALTEALE